MSRAAIVLLVVLIAGTYQYWSQRELSHPEGILVLQEPLQKPVPASIKPIKFKNVVLDPLAEFELQGRVLSTERYWMDKMANIVPIDIAFGWGVMSDTKVLEGLNLWQEARFYFYSWRGQAPSDPVMMGRQSANMHLIPSTEYVGQEIKKLRKGQLVKLQGYLVRVNYADGSDAKSSLTREDSGAGACEIIWVQSLQVL